MVPDVSEERVIFRYMAFSINLELLKKARRSVANPDPKVGPSGTGTPDVSEERVIFMYMAFSINLELLKMKATRSVANPDPKVRPNGTVQKAFQLPFC
jgi:hypothetical protein